MRLWKGHALGNVYLVLDGPPPPDPDLASLARTLCAGPGGPGADGILVPAPEIGDAHGVRILNPDGSEAETSGNGIRIYARFLHDVRGAPARLEVAAGGRTVRCEVRGEVVEAAMGRASFRPAEVPCRLPGPEAVEVPLPVAGYPLVVTAVGLGNPHCVVFADYDALPWRDLGRALEVHPAFPRRTNVQIARVADRGRVGIRIWERGAGPTQASGSSACAVAAAGVRTGRLDPAVTVESPGRMPR